MVRYSINRNLFYFMSNDAAHQMFMDYLLCENSCLKTQYSQASDLLQTLQMNLDMLNELIANVFDVSGNESSFVRIQVYDNSGNVVSCVASDCSGNFIPCMEFDGSGNILPCVLPPTAGGGERGLGLGFYGLGYPYGYYPYDYDYYYPYDYLYDHDCYRDLSGQSVPHVMHPMPAPMHHRELAPKPKPTHPMPIRPATLPKPYHPMPRPPKQKPYVVLAKPAPMVPPTPHPTKKDLPLDTNTTPPHTHPRHFYRRWGRYGPRLYSPLYF
jgi:hypothetical protein